MKNFRLLFLLGSLISGLAHAELCTPDNVTPFKPSTKKHNRIAVHGLLEKNQGDQDYILELWGHNPQSSDDLRYVIDHGFEKIGVSRFTKPEGELDTDFNSAAADPQKQGSIFLDYTNLQAQGENIFATDTTLLPAHIAPMPAVMTPHEGYLVFGSSRWNGQEQSKIFVAAIAKDGTIDTSFNKLNPGGNKGGSAVFTALSNSLRQAYANGGGTGQPCIKVEKVKLYGQKAVIVGTITEDPDVQPTGITQVQRGFIAVVDVQNIGAQITPTVLDQGTQLHDVTIDHATGSVSDINTDDRVYIAGTNAQGAFVKRYIVNNSSQTLYLDTTFHQTYSCQQASPGYSGKGDGGTYTYAKPGSKGLAIMMHQADTTSQEGIVLVVAEPVTVDPILKEAVTVVKLRKTAKVEKDTDCDGGLLVEYLDASFAPNTPTYETGNHYPGGQVTYYFDPLPQMTPLSYSPPYPEFSFSHQRFTLQTGKEHEIFVTGTLSVNAVPFVYKLDAHGNQMRYTKNFKHDINSNNELVQNLIDSPVLYPTVGQSWHGSMHGIYASAIDHDSNLLYLFGTHGRVDRNVDAANPLVRELQVYDSIKRVTTGNLTIHADLERVRMNALYTQQEIQVQVMDNLSDEDEITDNYDDGVEAASNVTNKNSSVKFCNFKIYSNPVRYETPGRKTLELHGTVEVASLAQSSGMRDLREVVALYSDPDLGFIVNGGGQLIQGVDFSYDANLLLLEAGTSYNGAPSLSGLDQLPGTVTSVLFKASDGSTIDILHGNVLPEDVNAIAAITDQNDADVTNSLPLDDVKTVLHKLIERKRILEGVSNNFRLVDRDGNILHEDNKPTRLNGGITQGVLHGQASDGTKFIFDIKSLELVDAEVIAVATEIKGQGHIALTNHYNEKPNGYNLSINNDYLQETANLNVHFDPATYENIVTLYNDEDGNNPAAVPSYNGTADSHSPIDSNIPTHQAPHTMILKDIKLDLLESEGTPVMVDHDNDAATIDQGAKTVFGYAKVWSSEFSKNPDHTDEAGWITFPLHGQILLSITNNKIDGQITPGNVLNPNIPTGSYVQGRSQFGRLSIKLLDGMLHATNPQAHKHIRQAAELELNAKLHLEYEKKTEGPVISIVSIQEEDPFTDVSDVTTHFSVNAADIIVKRSQVQRPITQKGLHFCKIEAEVPVKWSNVGENGNLVDGREITKVVVGGRLAFVVTEDGTMQKPKNCLLHGYLTDPVHGTVSVRLRIQDYSIIDVTTA